MHGGVEFSTGVSRQIPHDPKSNLTFLSVILNEIPIKDLKNNNSQDRKIPKQ
jgi:hypothetical protein